MQTTIAPEELKYGIDVTGLDPASLSDAVRAVIADVMMDPMRMSTWMAGFALAEQNVGLNMLRRLGGESPSSSPFPGDKRFAEEEWRSNPMLAGVLEDYRARTDAALALVDSARLPEATRRKARFAMQLMCDAYAPSNVPWLNPGVVKEATETGGESLVRGMQNFLDDVQNNGGYPRQVDRSGFELGRNLAATPGRVVMRNELIELIAYDPQTPAGSRDAAALQPAVDQQVLHHGSRAGTLVRGMGGQARPSDLHDLLPQSRRVALAPHDGRLPARRRARCARQGTGVHRCAARSTSPRSASAARSR